MRYVCLPGRLALAGLFTFQLLAPAVAGERFPRSGYRWPHDTGPHYGAVAPERARDAGVLHTRVGSFDLLAGELAFPDALRAREGFETSPQRHFVVSVDPARLDLDDLEAFKRAIVDSGGRFVDELPVASWIVRIGPEAYEVAVGRTEVIAVVPYHAAFKLHPDIGRRPLADERAALSDEYTLDVVRFVDTGTAELEAFVAAHGGTILRGSGDWSRIRLHRDHLDGLARVETVRAVYEHEPVGLSGQEIGAILQSGSVGSEPFHAAGVDGSGNRVPGTAPQVLMVMDTGADLDSADLADTMSDPGTPGPAHRKVEFYGTTASFGGGGDFEGGAPPDHGHSTCVTALGNASRVEPAYGAPWPELAGAEFVGVAPGARVAVYDFFVENPGSIEPGDLYSAPAGGSLPDALADHGARTVNFSWSTAFFSYVAESADVDDFLHDHPEAMIFVSVGNHSDPETVRAPATAKGSVAVGASYTASPTVSKEDRWPFSSQGPATSSQRVAPLLMAPGCDGLGGGPQEPFGCSSTDVDQDAPVECVPFEGACGTSSASPSAAGAALLVRDYFAQGLYPDGTSADPANVADQAEISGALLKALLVVSADWMGDGNTPGANLTVAYRPNNEQGFGRIELANALNLAGWADGPSGLRVHDAALPGGVSHLPLPATLNAVVGDVAFAPFQVVDPDQELRIVLAWVEAGGDTLINDLDLALVSPDPDGAGPLEPTVYIGNYFTDDNDRDGVVGAAEDCPGIDGTTAKLDQSPWSLPACDNATGDTTNLAEAIFLSPDADADGDFDPDFNQLIAGTWQLVVQAKPGGTAFDQPFAVAVAGGVTVDGTIEWDAATYDCGSAAAFQVLEVDAVGDPGGGLTPAEIESRVRVQVVDPDDGSILDEEQGIAISQPDGGVLRFRSTPVSLMPSGPATLGNGVVEVQDGRILRALYEDETHGAVDPGLQKRTTASVVCSASTPGGIAGVRAEAYDDVSGELTISYDPGCAGGDHTIVAGPLANVGSYDYQTQLCGIGDSGSHTFDPGTGSSFFLVVANDGAIEGSYGVDSGGSERPELLSDPGCALVQSLALPCE